MNHKMLFTRFGAAAVIAAFGLVACGDDTSSGPNTPDDITSSETSPASSENAQPASSGSKPASSSGITVSSSSAKELCEALTPECGYTPEELCAMDKTEYCTGSSSSAVDPESSSATNPDETCRHITDTGDPLKPHPCDTEFDVAMDCVKGYYLMCANGIWLNATGCDTTKEKCGFDDYVLCNSFQLRDYCSDNWLDEPCENGQTRDLRVYDSTDSTSFSMVNYICVEGKWEKRSSFYGNCDNDKDCLGGFQGCWQSEIIGQPCDERDPETAWITEDRCDFVCRDGKYEFVPPPTK